MGMDKSGSTQLLAGSTWTTITGWTARSGFPATVIESDGLVMGGSGIVTASGSMHTGTSSAGDFGIRVYKNASMVEEFFQTASGQTISGTTASFEVAAGDVLTLQGYRDSSGSTNAKTVQTGTSTYLYITLVP